jgi:N-acetylmuramoyl-L-alanine amidase
MYYTTRKFDSTVHVYEFSPTQLESNIEFGVQGKYETLSSIHNTTKLSQGYIELAKINLGFFGGNVEHNGIVFSPSLLQGSAEGKSVEVYLTKDGKFVVGSLTNKQVLELQPHVQWGCSLSYSLLVNGKKQFIGSENYSHFNQRNPRTLIGQRADGMMLLVVVEGRNEWSKGVTGEQSADILLGLGAIVGANCDGGGSSEMIINGSIVNQLSDGKERAIGTALVVYRKEVKKLKVGYCAGHSFNTLGKRSPDDEREWTFNDKVARAFAEELSKYDGVELKRFDDPTGKTDIPLKTRTDNANAWGADIYISFHHNANKAVWGNWTGIETFVYTSPSPNSEKLAKLIHPEMVKAYGLTDRGIKKENLHIVRELKCPSILVEGGFMDSTIDIKKLRDDNVLRNAGIGVANAVVKYGELKPKVAFQPKPEKVVEQPKVETPPVIKEGNKLYQPSSPALKTTSELVIKQMMQGDNGINKTWLEKYQAGSLTDSDMIGLIFVAIQRGLLK